MASVYKVLIPLTHFVTGPTLAVKAALIRSERPCFCSYLSMSIYKISIFFLLQLLLFTLPQGFAKKNIKLYKTDGSQMEHYNTRLNSLKAGDVLSFSDGKSFEFISHLGQGYTTKVIEVKHKNTVMALRLPVSNWMYRSAQSNEFIPYPDFINAFIDHHVKINMTDIAPKIYHSLRGQYIAVEKINIEIGLDDVLLNADTLQKEQPEKLLQLETKFIEFAKKLAPLQYIGDFKPEQMVYNGEKWILLDVLNIEVLPNNPTLAQYKKNPFHELLNETLFASHNDFTQVKPEVLEYIEQFKNKMIRITNKERLKYLGQNYNPLTNSEFKIKSESIEADNFRRRAKELSQKGSTAPNSCRIIF